MHASFAHQRQVAIILGHETEAAHRLAPAQFHLFGGCHLDRPIQEQLEDAGLEVAEIERFYGTGPKPFAFFYLGHATRP